MLSGIYYALAVKAATFGTNPFVSYTISGFLEVPACFGTLLMYQFLGKNFKTKGDYYKVNHRTKTVDFLFGVFCRVYISDDHVYSGDQ